ncbi:formate dehydrogenase subunit delta [Muricoccus nepalensis]|nr:formate dehydrogenase subunit delta [Roseomonas nepalensis]
MSGEEERLARMANQMADFFRAYPAEEARAGIRDHIEAFWTRRMRDALLAMVERRWTGLDPLVAGAFAGRSLGESPVRRETGGPEEVGPMGSDAG